MSKALVIAYLDTIGPKISLIKTDNKIILTMRVTISSSFEGRDNNKGEVLSIRTNPIDTPA